MSATTTQARQTTARPLTRPAVPGRSPIRVIPRPRAAPRAPFIGLVMLLLVGGLAALLVLNTLLAQGAFAVRDLSIRVADLQDREQALQQRVAELAAPQRLAHSASDLGMVPTVNPGFLRMSDGRILGDPVPAAAPVVVPPAESTAGDSTSQDSKPAENAAPDDSSKADGQGGQGQQGGQPGGQQQGDQQSQQGGQQQGGGQGSTDGGNTP